MNTIRRKFRPKHQVLVLRCYPQYQKSVTEVQPGSSELSYLLYYASTRPSKLQKVGAYLERRTPRDLWRGRTGNVQVTLQIVNALIVKCHRDLPLFSAYVLNILEAVLGSHDIQLLGDSVVTFATFTAQYDSATLSADYGHTRQFDRIVQIYVSFASKDKPNHHSLTSVPVETRCRHSGLQAVKSLVSADAFASTDNARLIPMLLPAVLQNLHSERPNYFSLLQYRANSNEQFEKEQQYRRRQSMNLLRTTTDTSEADPSAVIGTTADIDQRADEELGVLALQSLQKLFSANNRLQIRVGTSAVLDFIRNNLSRTKSRNGTFAVTVAELGWCAKLFELICRWAPVQDRFAILVTMVESLAQSPISEDGIDYQLVVTGSIDKLLSSSINFIGLSIMDVLVGLIQHVILLLQLEDGVYKPVPYDHQTFGLVANQQGAESHGINQPLLGSTRNMTTPSVPRVQLLEQLQQCIIDLGIHVYYSDQIGDMVSALLRRMTPSPASGIINTVSAIEQPSRTADGIAGAGTLQEKPQTDRYFSIDAARVFALRAVKQILCIANSQPKSGGSGEARNPVDMSVWDGTQWLLPDPDKKVRHSYVDAFLTWLKFELDGTTSRLVKENVQASMFTMKETEGAMATVFGKRVMSNASQITRSRARECRSFLQLLHLTIYESVLRFAESEPDLLCLYLLLVELTQKLGVNSVRSTLPVVFRLQEDALLASSTAAKLGIASVAHGYLWALIEIFHLENTVVGREIQNEIVRRSHSGMWLRSIQWPPAPLEALSNLPESQSSPAEPVESADTQTLKPFSFRSELVGCIADAYAKSVAPPPTSPPVSPGRKFSFVGVSTADSAGLTSGFDITLPHSAREDMLAEWSKEACIAAFASASSKAASLSGSRSATGSAKRGLLFTNGDTSGTSDANLPSTEVQPDHNMSQSAVHGIRGSIGSVRQGHRRVSPGSSRTPASASSAPAVVRVNELKQVLAGTCSVILSPPSSYRERQSGTGTNSLVSASVSSSGSEMSLPATADVTEQEPTAEVQNTTVAREAWPHHDGVADAGGSALPQPKSLRNYTSSNELQRHDTTDDVKEQSILEPRLSNSASWESNHQHIRLKDGASSWGRPPGAVVDLKELLDEIDTTARRPLTAMESPPY